MAGRTLGLVSCTKRKRSVQCMAAEMYLASPLFSKAYAYAMGHYDRVLILSAEYGLLDPDTAIDPYDTTLNKMLKAEREIWTEGVWEKLTADWADLRKYREIYFHAGRRYREPLIDWLKFNGFNCHVPLEGLGIGEQMRWYNKRDDERKKFHDSLEEVLRANPPELNTSQVCRLFNGAKGKHDIKFCTSGIKDAWTDGGNFAKHGNHSYRNCVGCGTNWKKIYYHLTILEKDERVESRAEWRSDPIVKGRKDKFRMWALPGGLPSMDRFLV